MKGYKEEFRRLSRPLVEQINEAASDMGPGYLGGQADLTPLKNRAREATEALTDAQRAADAGRAEDAQEALRRARSAIDAALGGEIGPYPAQGVPGSVAGQGQGPGKF